MKTLAFVIMLLIVMLAIFVAIARAQTTVSVGPVTTSMRLAFDCSANIVPQTPAECLTYEWRLRDGTFIPVTALQNVACAAAPAGGMVPCSAPISQANADALNRAGVHNLTLAGFRADTVEGGQSSPFRLLSPAVAPTALRITP